MIESLVQVMGSGTHATSEIAAVGRVDVQMQGKLSGQTASAAKIPLASVF
jgi:hypothetical protein